MNEKEFRALVQRMREAQKKYFETRDGRWLVRSKELERTVDRELSNQQSLNL